MVIIQVKDRNALYFGKETRHREIFREEQSDGTAFLKDPSPEVQSGTPDEGYLLF
jgi:hypothetical protein